MKFRISGLLVFTCGQIDVERDSEANTRSREFSSRTRRERLPLNSVACVIHDLHCWSELFWAQHVQTQPQVRPVLKARAI
jgi:hypothetical protein